MKITCEFEDAVEVHTYHHDGELIVTVTLHTEGGPATVYMKSEKARRLAAALDNKANQAEHEGREDPP